MIIISQFDENAVKIAQEYLLAGKVIAIPTDTVYGLAVDATNFQAVKKLFAIKNRSQNKPIAIFLKNKSFIKKLFAKNKLLDKLSKDFLPGKITIISKLRANPKIILANNLNIDQQEYLGFRIVDSYFIKKLFKDFNHVLAVSSANISSMRVLKSVDEIINSKMSIDLVIAGEILDNLPSTVVKLENDQITIIRQGITKINY